jgi:DNA primase
VEGEFDALGWHAASLAVGRGFELVALGGAAKPTVEKFRTLGSLGAGAVYLALDADPAGETATALACRSAWEAGLDAGILSMPDGCKDPDEVLVRHGPADGTRLLFGLDRAEPGATWLARYHLRHLPPVTLEQTARLREVAAETARVMPGSSRSRYGAVMGEALGVSPEALLAEWARHATQAWTRAICEDVRHWAAEWSARLDHAGLAGSLDEASRVLAQTRARLETATHPMAWPCGPTSDDGRREPEGSPMGGAEASRVPNTAVRRRCASPSP